MLKVVIDDAIPYIKGVLEPFCRVEYIPGRDISPADVEDADALIVRTRTRCDASLLGDSAVQVIATATIGFDHIDTKWCRKVGIAVFSAAGCNSRGVLQWLAAVLDRDSAVKGWNPEDKTIGIVGTGNVGSLAARYSKAWGFNVLCCDPPRQKKGKLPAPVEGGYVDLDEICDRCDIISFHVPLTHGGDHPTYHLADERFFSKLKPGTLFINSSRGGVADTAALSAAIAGGVCRAAVDTWEHEPDIDRELLGLTSLATPHIAGYTAQGKANATAMSVRSVASFFGLPLGGWYPPEVAPVQQREISWAEMRSTIKDHFDILADDAALRADPSDFEALRTHYKYRQEYF